MAETTRDALTILDRLVGDDTGLRALIDEEVVNAQVARMVREARLRAGLTQKQLAERIGSRQPVIARLEDADYRGHSLTMLRRVATALGMRIQIRFLPAPAAG